MYGKFWDTTLKACYLSSDANSFVFLGGEDEGNANVTAYSFIQGGGGFVNGSLESIKKNIEPFNGALELVKNTDIYSYNMKTENDEDKKHIGCIIADNGGDYKTANEIISANNKGIDSYSMASVLWQAVKEQQEIIEKLKEEITLLKESDK